MAQIVNLTPHPIVLVDGEGKPAVTIPPTGVQARCSTTRKVVDTIEVEGLNVPVTSVVLGALEGLPEADEGTVFVASRIACEAAKALGRTDVVCPDDAVRDAEGKIIGVKSLARV